MIFMMSSQWQVEGERLVPPSPLPWYPQKLAWQLTYSRTQLRKLDSLNAVHELLKQENVSGGITRQEAVSMAPPLFLDIQSHHKASLSAFKKHSTYVHLLDSRAALDFTIAVKLFRDILRIECPGVPHCHLRKSALL